MGFWSVSGCFLVFEREDKMCRKVVQKANFIKKSVSSLVYGCLGLFIALGANFKAVVFKGPQKVWIWVPLEIS